MSADINAQDFLLKGQHHLPGVLSYIRHSDLILGLILFIHDVKEGQLPGHIILPGALQVIQHPHVDTHHLFAGSAQAVQGTGFNETLNDPAVDLPFLHDHSGQEIMQIAEWPSGLSLRDDPVDDRPAHAFDRCQTIADGSA